MVDQRIVSSLARHWEEGWNGPDLEVIMEPLGPDVLFTSPFVAGYFGDASRTTVEGVDALRQYIEAALERSGDVRYTLDGAYGGTDSVILVYTCHLPDGSDKPGADVMRVDAAGRVVEWKCHYQTDPVTWRA